MNNHVIPSGGKWKVRRAGSLRATRVFKSKDEAIAFAKSASLFVYIHDETGRITERFSTLDPATVEAMKRLASK